MIGTLNRSVAVFFNMASLEALATRDGRGRGERGVEVNSGDSWDNIREFEGGYVGDR